MRTLNAGLPTEMVVMANARRETVSSVKGSAGRRKALPGTGTTGSASLVRSKLNATLIDASMKRAVNGGTTIPKTALIAAIATPLSLGKCAKRLVVHLIGIPTPATRAGKSSK